MLVATHGGQGERRTPGTKHVPRVYRAKHAPPTDLRHPAERLMRACKGEGAGQTPRNSGDLLLMPTDDARAVPVGHLIRQVPYDARSIPLIAESLGGEATLAPFRLPGAAVHQILVSGAGGRPGALLTLWPSIRRVDAVGGSATVVFTDVTTVDLVGEIEVQFRRTTREYLIVARGGKIIVRA